MRSCWLRSIARSPETFDTTSNGPLRRAFFFHALAACHPPETRITDGAGLESPMFQIFYRPWDRHDTPHRYPVLLPSQEMRTTIAELRLKYFEVWYERAAS